MSGTEAWTLAPVWRRRDTLRCPVDIDEAAEVWGANCGPGALAGLLGVDLANVRLAFNAGGKWPGYANPTKMLGALSAMGLAGRPRGAETPPSGDGLIFVQFTGPWEAVTRAAYRHTHWIAYSWKRLQDGYGNEEGEPLLFTYDINWGKFGAWMPLEDWARVLAPRLADYPRCTGWRWRQVIEVS
jgi:hypothetical protein